MKSSIFIVMAMFFLGQNSFARLVIDIPKMVFFSHDKTEVKAEKLALEAEKMSEIQAYEFADEIAQAAIDLDPSNLRANYVMNTVKFNMKFKGIAKRLQPIIDSMPDVWKKGFAELNNSINDPILKRFYIQTEEKPFASVTEVEEHLKSIIQDIDQQLQFLKESENKKLKIYLFEVGRDSNSYQRCEVFEMAPGVYAVETCPLWQEARKEMTIDKYDWKALQLEMIDIKWKATLLFSYSLDGLTEIINNLGDVEKLTIKKIIEAIKKSPQFGRIVDANSLKSLEPIAGQANLLIKDLRRSNNCTTGQDISRPLNRFDLKCIHPTWPFFSGEKNLYQGNPVDEIIDLEKELVFSKEKNDAQTPEKKKYKFIKYNTKVDMSILSQGGIPTIQNILPNKFNDCGQIIAFEDSTFGMMFPRGDGTYILNRIRGFKDFNSMNSDCQNKWKKRE